MGVIVEDWNGVRIESGPAKRVAKATKKLLDNRSTKSHYQVGRFDAVGKVIQLNKPMTYLDWFGTYVWYIYKWGKVGIDANGVVILPNDESGRKAAYVEERWIPVGVEETKAAAMTVAAEIAGGKT